MTRGEFFVLEFESRNDGGPMRIGPFESRDAAFDYAHSLAHYGWSASYLAVPVIRRCGATNRTTSHETCFDQRKRVKYEHG